MKKIIVAFVLLALIVCSVFADKEVSIGLKYDLVIPEDFFEKGGPVPSDRPSVALVLSGGGAKGIAHIAIIEALEEYGIPIDKVFGTSMGALVGGLYAAGLSPKEMKEVVSSNDLMSLFTSFESTGYNEVLNAFDFNSNNVLSISLGQGIGGVTGLVDDYLVLNFLTKYVGNVPEDIDFDYDLVVPFECNACSLLTGDEVLFREGSLITAMRSSMSIPVVFEPVLLDNGDVVMDGGAESNYIVHRAAIEGYDIIIVVTLNGYNKKERTADDVTSFSGVVGAALGVVLNNASRGEVDLADYWFSPDTTEYTTFSFNKPIEILEAGEREVEAQREKFEAIAALFTEEQKVYKDPNRVGEYFLRYTVREKGDYLSSKDARHEDLLGRTRISLGLYGTGGLGFDFRPDTEAEDEPRFALFPTFSIRGFLKDVGGSPVSLDSRLRITINRTVDLSVMGLFRFTPDTGERALMIARVRGSVGSLTFFTDKNEPFRVNYIEGILGADLGFMLTNEFNHNIMLYASADNYWGEMYKNLSGDAGYGFAPSATLEAVYYPEYENGFFSTLGGRYDFKATAGYYCYNSQWFYKLALAAENTFKVNDKVSVWVDGVAVSSRSDFSMRSSFEEYGGWDGMPGYAAGTFMSEYVTGGVGVQVNLKKSFASSYLAFVVRGGVRADVMYGWYGYYAAEFDSMIPFSGCFTSGIWDLGASVGWGLSTPVGDVLVGAGFNKDLQLALYVELT
ncbi:MAG: patatin-like phospholipase family protein [Spirochaetales bacterium]|nr:patatin-like phospholipase family protein [Spirochaetales bacterium]